MTEKTINLQFEGKTRDHLTDAELCALWAAVALKDGRYDLGAELSHLAQRAAAASTPDVSTMGGRFASASSAGSRDLAAWREAPRSHAPQSCAYVVERTASYDDEIRSIRCGQPISWAGDELAGGWYHLDPEITDHEPELE